MSNKIVINGSFPSVREININQSLSLEFEPSNIDSLANVIQYALINYEELRCKYKNVAEYAINNLSYLQHVNKI